MVLLKYAGNSGVGDFHPVYDGFASRKLAPWSYGRGAVAYVQTLTG